MSLELKFRVPTDRIVSDAKIFSIDDKQLSVRALWDTGAMTCCIKPSVVSKLGLQQVGSVKDVKVVGGSYIDRPVIRADIQVSNTVKFHELEFVVLDESDMVTDVIVGMNLISKGTLKIDGSVPGWLFFDFY